jgi:4,5-DOPA dioxygenase extradiol
MNAVLDNPFTRAMGKLGRDLPRPKAILCVSAHWLTEGGLLLNGPRTSKPSTTFTAFPGNSIK